MTTCRICELEKHPDGLEPCSFTGPVYFWKNGPPAKSAGHDGWWFAANRTGECQSPAPACQASLLLLAPGETCYYSYALPAPWMYPWRCRAIAPGDCSDYSSVNGRE